jgi:hypothetical protein
MPIDPENTANLKLPFIMPSQAQKHVTHNEALRTLDALVQPSVLDKDRAEPPANPAEGDRYIVATGATDGWSGRAGQLAAYMDGAWFFFAPRTGWICHVADEERLYLFDGAAWIDAVTALAHEFQNLALLGLGTTADAENPLSAKLDNVLLTSRYSSEGGTGDLRIKANKEVAAGTASFLFQTGWSGRAEFGLTGSDKFTLKVSADGATWKTPFVIDNSSGYIGLGTDQPLTPLHLHVGGGAQPASALVTSDDFMISKNAAAAGFSGTVAGHPAGARMVFKGTRARGTVDTPAAVEDGDEVISLLGAIYDGSAVRATAQISLTADGTSTEGAAPQRISFWTGQTTGRTERMRIDSAGQAYFQGVGTTASGANAVLAAGSSPANALLRSTSSLAWKKDVEPVDPAYSRALMALDPIWYRSKAAADREEWSWWGFAAEEVAAVDPRLVSWGFREEDYEWAEAEDEAGGNRCEPRLRKGAEKKPDGVAYDRFVVHHHVMIKALMAEMETLKEKMAALAG